jgi:tetratricopeptide (TPR) repeat protein
LGPVDTLQRFKELDATAQRAVDAANYALAIEKYRQAACLVPSSGRAFYGLGISEAASGEYSEARASLEKADALLRNNPMPLAMLLRVESALNDTDGMKLTLRNLAARFPTDAGLHAATARFLAENHQLDLALAESLRFQQAGGTDPEAAVAAAALENQVGAFEDAIQSAASIKAQSAVPLRTRAAAAGLAGLSLESLGRREEAIESLREAVQLDPAGENSTLALAFLYEKTNRYRDAVQLLQLALKHLPQSIPIQLALGQHLVWSEQYETGIRVLKEVLRKAPDQTEAYVRLAEAYRNTGQPERESQILRDLAAAKPDYPMLHILIAKAILNSSQPDYEKVLDELAAAEKLTPEDPDVFYLRGKVLVACRRYEAAIAPLRHAIELRPTEPSPYYQLALVYQKLGKPELAREQTDRMQHLKSTR